MARKGQIDINQLVIDSGASSDAPQLIPQKVIDGVRKEIVATFGADAIVDQKRTAEGYMLGNIKSWMGTRLLGLDGVLGREGYGMPAGKLIEIFGEEGHGKSSLLLYILGLVQQAGGLAVLIDSEASYDPEWAATMGLDPNAVLLLPPTDDSCVELYFNQIEAITLRARKSFKGPIWFGFDTIVCCPTKESLKLMSYTDVDRIGSLARTLSACLPSLCRFISKYDIGLIFINQVRENIGIRFGKKLKTPGGRNFRHMCAIRAMVRRKRKLPNGAIESVIANEKNKVAPPFSKSHIRISQGGIIAVRGSESEEDTDD